MFPIFTSRGSTKAFLGIAAVAALAAVSAPVEAATLVDLELSLLVDVSGSVSGSEFALQRDGYVAAFKNASIVDAIQAGTEGKIAVNYVYWSGSSSQEETVGWTLIEDAATAEAFADAIAAAPRPFSGLTAIGSALEFATPLFASNDFDAPRQVIDVSGDGITNDGSSTSAASAAAIAAGIDTINGLTIAGETGLEAFYTASVLAGTDPFLESASGFADFASAVDRKIEREIIVDTEVPEPATTLGLLALSAFGGRNILKRKQRSGEEAGA